MSTDTNTYLDFQIDPGSVRATRLVEQPRPGLQPGQVRFRVDEFALTANNITYATAGAFLGYLDFFPVGDGRWRRIPVMGHGEIIESAHPGIAVGGRYFGFFPMAAEHVLTAEPRGSGVWDAGAHRQPHASAYRQFEDVRSDPNYDPNREAQVALLRGLFVTSFLVDDYLADNRDFGATSVLVTSASSKTSISLGFCLQQRSLASVGITSARHLDAVAALGCYDRVLAYDDIGSLDASVPTTVVDMAGDGVVLARIHGHFDDNLRCSCIVGATHRDSVRQSEELPGATPQFFFAPGQIEKRAKDWGPGEVMRRVGQSFRSFCEFADTWLEIERGAGGEAARDAYLDVLDGAKRPTTGVILTLS